MMNSLPDLRGAHWLRRFLKKPIYKQTDELPKPQATLQSESLEFRLFGQPISKNGEHTAMAVLSVAGTTQTKPLEHADAVTPCRRVGRKPLPKERSENQLRLFRPAAQVLRKRIFPR